MLELRKIDFNYPNQPPLFEGFSWQVGHGESWAILGASGCGKSTMLYLLAGLRYPTEGQILVSGEALTEPRPKTGLILQDYGLMPWATVQENAALGLRLRRFYGPDGRHAPREVLVEDVQNQANHWLTRVGLEDVQDKYPGQISGGQRQRTAIARTLALDPDLLLMDEPFASLDVPTRQSLQKLILDLRQEQNLTSVIVTHSIEEAAILGERILVLGHAPNKTPTTLTNPQANNPDFSRSSDYIEVCTQLRQMLEPSA